MAKRFELLGGHPVFAPEPHPYAPEHLILDAYLSEACESPSAQWRNPKPKNLQAGREILDADPARQALFAVCAAERALWHAHAMPADLSDMMHFRRSELVAELLSALLRRKVPFTVEQLADIVYLAAAVPDGWNPVAVLPGKAIVTHAERYRTDTGFPAPLQDALEGLLQATAGSRRDDAEVRTFRVRLEALLGTTAAQASPQESWLEALHAVTDGLTGEAQGHWNALLAHARQLQNAKPSRKWWTECERLVADVGPSALRERLQRPIDALGRDADVPIATEHADLLRGLLFAAAVAGGDDATRLLGAATAAAGKKIRGHGLRSTKVFNGGVAALAQLDGMPPVMTLVALRAKVKGPTPAKVIATALARMAEARGLGPEDLEELAVPAMGFTDLGVLERRIGDATVRIEIAGTAAVKTTWTNASGKVQRSIPKTARDAAPDDVKEVTRVAKDLKTVLAAQRDRIERLLLVPGRTLPFPTWRERYLDHPVVGPLARRLIWRFEGEAQRTGAWNGGRMVDAEDRALDGLDTTSVGLWHPIDVPAAEVQAWRAWLLRHEISQPFKQAHREIYILTEAERATNDYSNRFAAHILKQHQVAALCRTRGWRYQLQGAFDNVSLPTRELPAWNLEVEFSLEPAWEGEIAESGIALYVATDFVRFVRPDTRRPVPLATVPPLVFSEVMRDVDLFVGVCTVGADPTWADQGAALGADAYWRSYAFGDLSESAATRHDVLVDLVPRLKIRDRCTVTGRFLVVEGKQRTYKIHLGSANILMEPNDQYLCIVSDRSAAAKGTTNVWLPFEGDRTLSLILSKAFLLAEDDKITDPSIRTQIDRR